MAKKAEMGIHKKTLLIVLTCLFIFGAPYVSYLATHVLKKGPVFSFAASLLSLAVGLVLLAYLLKSKIV